MGQEVSTSQEDNLLSLAVLRLERTAGVGDETFSAVAAYPPTREDVMKAYLNSLPMRTWLLLVVPAVVIAYPVVCVVVPAVVHAVVPEVVRTVLSVI